MVKCKLKLNSSLTDSVREEFQLQFGSSHFHGPAHTVLFSAAGVSLGWVAGRSGGRAVRLAGQAGGRPVRAQAGGQASARVSNKMCLYLALLRNRPLCSEQNMTEAR